MEKRKVVVTAGDPAGIGPEIALKALAAPDVSAMCDGLLFGPFAQISSLHASLGLHTTLRRCAGFADFDASPGVVNVVDVPCQGAVEIGKVSDIGGRVAADTIIAAVAAVSRGEADVMATAPINKESLKAAGVPFIGHTEMIADLTGARDPMTMFNIKKLKIFFLSRHVSLREACDLVTSHNVLTALRRVSKAMQQLGYDRPSIAVAGLNPHSGEGGLLGMEEITEIKPAIADAIALGLEVHGPVPADSVFFLANQGHYDAVLSLYHDQGHIASKMLDFDHTVSVTLGLPILRTSVDHGTAFDIAGKGIANEVSMMEAIKVGVELSARGASLAV